MDAQRPLLICYEQQELCAARQRDVPVGGLQLQPAAVGGADGAGRPPGRGQLLLCVRAQGQDVQRHDPPLPRPSQNSAAEHPDGRGCGGGARLPCCLVLQQAAAALRPHDTYPGIIYSRSPVHFITLVLIGGMYVMTFPARWRVHGRCTCPACGCTHTQRGKGAGTEVGGLSMNRIQIRAMIPDVLCVTPERETAWGSQMEHEFNMVWY
mmetsp:Transcript_12582/g.31751  ORF Transcript_12582/g.31751 Transcript_12582/m.31751 type:complete len:209 (+) Transcript_12582:1050-1676(+)